MSGAGEPDLIDAMVVVIRNAAIDSATARLAATIISVDANFNARVCALKGGVVSKDRMLDILDFSDEVLDDCRSIAKDVERGIDCKMLMGRLQVLCDKILMYDVHL